MTTYRARACGFCKCQFTPTSSRQKHCSATCRFKSIAAPFSGSGACWEWPMSRQPSGYGQMTTTPRPNQVVVTAHRFSYEVFVGAIAPGQCVMHKCDNRSCFNPAHLTVGTIADNNNDMTEKGRAGWSLPGVWPEVMRKAWVTRKANYGQSTSRNRTPA